MGDQIYPTFLIPWIWNLFIEIQKDIIIASYLSSKEVLSMSTSEQEQTWQYKPDVDLDFVSTKGWNSVTSLGCLNKL